MSSVFLSPSSSLLETGSLIKPGSHRLARLVWPASSGDLPVSESSSIPSARVTEMCHHIRGLLGYWGFKLRSSSLQAKHLT